MSNLDEYLYEKLKKWPELQGVPLPVIREVIMTSLAFLAELPCDITETVPPVATLENMLNGPPTHAVCTKCDSIVPLRLVNQEEPQHPTHIPIPTMCVPCWNACCVETSREEDMRCETCGRPVPCEEPDCNIPKEAAS